MTLPDSHLLADALDRAAVDLDPIDRDRLSTYVSLSWEALETGGHNRARDCALALLYRAADIRRHEPSSQLADSLDRCAEAFVRAWANEVDVIASLAAIDQD